MLGIMEINYPQGSKRQISFQIGWKMMRGKDAFISAIHDSAEKCPGNHHDHHWHRK